MLVGNQNCGKSTIFNILTASKQKIGNWPGVTVRKKSGIIKDMEIELIDLPGTYSLSPYSLEEKITCGALMNEEYDFIINVVDASTLIFTVESPFVSVHFSSDCILYSPPNFFK